MERGRPYYPELACLLVMWPSRPKLFNVLFSLGGEKEVKVDDS